MDSGLAVADLQRHKLFEGVPPEALTAFLRYMQRQAYSEGEVIISEGEHGNRLYLIESGRCEVCKHVFTREAIGPQSLAILEPGETFGEMELLDGQPRSATVRGLEAGTLLTLAESDLVASADADFPTYIRLMRNIAKEVSIRLRQSDRWLAGSLFSSRTPPGENPPD